jgi:toluene monooxygenase system protein E
VSDGGDIRTYSLLGKRTSAPSEYEIVTSRLLYYPGRGFALDVPAREWYARYQQGSPLRARDWDAFVDPRETTYTKYTRLQKAGERRIDALFETIETERYDERLPRAWLETLSRAWAPQRYLFHGLHMAASYVGKMAPSGRIAMAALFQSADELRRIERIAYRMRKLQDVWPEFGQDSKQLWQDDPLWQPAREAVERLLVSYDFGEALVALNVCIKPVLDEVAMRLLAERARRGVDPHLAELLDALREDCTWQRAWTAALLALARKDDPDSERAIRTWTAAWMPLAVRAGDGLLALFEEPGLRVGAVATFASDHLRALGLHVTNGAAR